MLVFEDNWSQGNANLWQEWEVTEKSDGFIRNNLVTWNIKYTAIFIVEFRLLRCLFPIISCGHRYHSIYCWCTYLEMIYKLTRLFWKWDNAVESAVWYFVSFISHAVNQHCAYHILKMLFISAIKHGVQQPRTIAWLARHFFVFFTLSVRWPRKDLQQQSLLYNRALSTGSE